MEQSQHVCSNHDDQEYDRWIESISSRFNKLAEYGPVFLVDAGDLWPVYLESFTDPVEKQYHNCSTCKGFIRRFGSLAYIDDDGLIGSAVWSVDEAPEQYKAAVTAMEKAVRRGRIVGGGEI